MVMICYLSIGGKLFVTQIQRKLKRKRKQKRNRGRHLWGAALRAPLAGSPACVFVFVFALIYAYFELIMKVIDDDDDDFDDDDERKTSKKNNFVSNDRSDHDDQNAY